MRAGQLGPTAIILNDFFLLLLGLYFLAGVLPQALLLFTAVAWHEASHALIARRLGWQVSSVELFPFGGVARLVRPPGKTHRDEALIALAGPLASFLLALVVTLGSQLVQPQPAGLLFFRQVNLILAVFNLWPGLPLDGGRIYRAWRAGFTGLYRATMEGVYGGQVLAVLLGLASIAGFYLRVVDLQGLALALFIYYAARREGEVAPYMFWQDFWRQRGRQGGKGRKVPASQVFWLVADPELTLVRVTRSFSPRSFNLVAVIGKGGRLDGILTEREILQQLLENGNDTLASLLGR